MIKVENKSRKEIADIGRRIGEAFADEKAELLRCSQESKQ